MFDLIKYSSIYCKMDCKVLMDGYCVFRDWMLVHTESYVNSLNHNSTISQFIHVEQWLL